MWDRGQRGNVGFIMHVGALSGANCIVREAD
jgi:hypothetical protein